MQRRSCLLCTAILIILALASFPVFPDTFLVIAEETRDGEEYHQPLPSKEALMSFLFDHDHIVFDTGAIELTVDWDVLGFKEPLAVAGRGGARFLIAYRVESQLNPAVPGRNPKGAPLIESLAHYALFEVKTSSLIGSGRLVMDNHGQEEELPYEKLLNKIG